MGTSITPRTARQAVAAGLALVLGAGLAGTSGLAWAESSGSRITTPGEGTRYAAHTTARIEAEVVRSTLDDGSPVTLSIIDPTGGVAEVASTRGTGTLSFGLDTNCYAGAATDSCAGIRPAVNGTWSATLRGNGASDSVRFLIQIPPRTPGDLRGEPRSPEEAVLSWNRNPEPDMVSYEVLDTTGEERPVATLAAGDCTSRCSTLLRFSPDETRSRSFVVQANRRTAPNATTVLSSRSSTSFELPSPPPPPPPAPEESPSEEPGGGASPSPGSGGSPSPGSGGSPSPGSGGPSGGGPSSGGPSSGGPSSGGPSSGGPSSGGPSSGGPSSGGPSSGGGSTAKPGAQPGSSPSNRPSTTTPRFTFKPSGPPVPVSSKFSYSFGRGSGFAPNLPGVPDPFGTAGVLPEELGGKPRSEGSFEETLRYPDQGDQYIAEPDGQELVAGPTPVQRAAEQRSLREEEAARNLAAPIAGSLVLLMLAAHVQAWARRRSR